jgi:hypothetical protein
MSGILTTIDAELPTRMINFPQSKIDTSSTFFFANMISGALEHLCLLEGVSGRSR